MIQEEPQGTPIQEVKPTGKQEFRGKEKLNLDFVYSPGGMKLPQVRKFVNFNSEENERFVADVLDNEENLPVHASIQKPTIQDWTNATDQDRTAMRRSWYRDNALAVDHIGKMQQTVNRNTWDNGIKVLKSASVEEFRGLWERHDVKKKAQYHMIEPQDVSLADTIAKVEGTDTKAVKQGYQSGYDVTLGYGKFDPDWWNSKEQSLSALTVGEVIKLQGDILRHPDNNLNSSALGKWQLTRRTLTDLMNRKVIDISETDKFTPELQDRIFYALAERRGLSAYKQGKLSKAKFLANLGQEWEGIAKFSSNIDKVLNDIKATV